MTNAKTNNTSDTLLLQQLKNDNKRAFQILFEKYWQQGFSDAYKRVKDYDAAKDIVQEIFTQIWINREKQHIENFPAYLNIAIRNRVIKFFTREKHAHSFFDIAEKIAQKNCAADGNLLWKEFSTSYENLLKSLPEKRQIIFRLRYQDDLSTKAISNQLGITRKTVQNQLGKAIETLKVSLLRFLIIPLLLLTVS
ncbi:MAG TPA: sigma-70 family RNA polymerase sigma factor [Chitinophagaceae bacterium]|nr:sigma-70 family RNA polymerase sigma factor [Chitinophagaceae bacterium]